MPNQRAKGMKFVGAWCPDEMVSAVETWIAREKRKRRVNRSDFLVEAARELLQREGIPIAGEVMRTGEKRAANSQDALNEGPLAAPLPEAKPASYKPRKKKRPDG